MRHEFAFYTPQASLLSARFALNDTCKLDNKLDSELVHRATQVIRVQANDTLILFDEKHIVRMQVSEFIKKQSLTGVILSKTIPAALKPTIEWIVPLLEREPFEEALSYLTILGATTIYPVITEKVHRTSVTQKEWERIRRLMIAACEQSKQFVLPKIEPITTLTNLSSLLKNIPSKTKLFFDPTGQPAAQVMRDLEVNLSENTEFICMVGPEGDLTNQEKCLLSEHNFTFCALTPSILRSQHAIMVSMGMLRSFLNK